MKKDKYIEDFERAFEIALPYIESASSKWSSSDWKMTPDALKNTLNYIFNVISHHCDMLCVDSGGELALYKLKPMDINASARASISRKLVKMEKNPFMTIKQKDYVREFVDEPLRIMQCIVKHSLKHPVNRGGDEGVGDVVHENEYLSIFSRLVIAPGVYIISLTDAVILREDMTYPFPMVYGKRKKLEEMGVDGDGFLPIMSLSGMHGYKDVAIPNYDDINFILGGGVAGAKLPDISSWTVDWADKTIDRAVFRGGATGCGVTSFSNQRIKIAEMGMKKKNDDYLDAGITGSGVSIDTKSVKFDPLYGIGVMNTHIKPAGFMSMAQQSKHKYIVHIDGNVNAYRFLTTMLTGSLIIRVKSKYTAWFEGLVKAGVHFIEVDSNMNDLIGAIKWCHEHDDECRVIAESGRDFALSMIANGGLAMLQYTQDMFSLVSGGDKVVVSGPVVAEAEAEAEVEAEPVVADAQEEVVVDAEPEPIVVEDIVAKVSDSLIDFPEGKGRCPKGYTVKNVKGKKMCKKTKKKMVVEKAEPIVAVAEPEVVPEVVAEVVEEVVAEPEVVEAVVVSEPNVVEEVVVAEPESEVVAEPKKLASDSLIDFPEGKGRCPNGYTVKNVKGKKMCKKTKKKGVGSKGGRSKKLKWT